MTANIQTALEHSMSDHPLAGLDLNDPKIADLYDENEPNRLFPVVYGRALSAGVLGWVRHARVALQIVRRFDQESTGLLLSPKTFGVKLMTTPTCRRAVFLVNRKADIVKPDEPEHAPIYSTRSAASFDSGWDWYYSNRPEPTSVSCGR